jgi:uncharacterized protein (UPF0371 family)
MEAIHIRRVSPGLARDVKIAALKEGKTQREWVLEVLARAVDGDMVTRLEDRLDIRVAHPPVATPLKD